MGKTYTYHLRLEREDANRVMRTWYEEGLSRSAILRMAIDDIPLTQVVQRLAGMKVARPGEPFGMEKIPFSIHQPQRQKLDVLINANVEAAFVIRHSMRRYLDKPVEDLMLIPGTMRAQGKQRKKIERAKLRDKLVAGDALDPHGATARIAEARSGHSPTAAAQVPIRAPVVDWTRTGPVKPRRASAGAQEAVKEFQAPELPPHPREESAALQAAMAGVVHAEPEAAPESKPAKLSPLDVLRKKQGK